MGKLIKKEKYKGTTFLEVMVVVAIVTIMASVALLSLGPTRNSVRLNAARREVVSVIELAKSYALQGKTADDGSGNIITPCGYGFRFRPDDRKNYELFYTPLDGSVPDWDCAKQNLSSGYRQYVDGLSMSAEAFVLPASVIIKKTDDNISPNNNTTEFFFTVPHASIYNRLGGALTSAGASFIFCVDANSDSTCGSVAKEPKIQFQLGTNGAVTDL